MLIDQRLQQLLVPQILPALYPQTAPDETAAPFSTYTLFNAMNLTTHSAPLPATRMWHLQITTWSDSYGQVRTISTDVSNFLIGYTDPYILGITPMSEKPLWDDIVKYHGWALTVLVTEQLGS